MWRIQASGFGSVSTVPLPTIKHSLCLPEGNGCSRHGGFALTYPLLKAISVSQHLPLSYVVTPQGSPALPSSNAGGAADAQSGTREAWPPSFQFFWQRMDSWVVQSISGQSWRCGISTCHNPTHVWGWYWQIIAYQAKKNAELFFISEMWEISQVHFMLFIQ